MYVQNNYKHPRKTGQGDGLKNVVDCRPGLTWDVPAQRTPMQHPYSPLHPLNQVHTPVTIEYPSGLTEEATLLGVESNGQAIVLEGDYSAQDIKEYIAVGLDKPAAACFNLHGTWFEFCGTYPTIDLAARWDALFQAVEAEEVKQGCPADQMPIVTRVWPCDLDEYTSPGVVFQMWEAPTRCFLFRVVSKDELKGSSLPPPSQPPVTVPWAKGIDAGNQFYIYEA